MSDAMSGGFGKFVPGFDFLQNLAKGATEAMPQMPNLANWIAPTLNLEELDKRISELKTVHFWLEQNARALGATVQALEVQKMTLTTLKGMNFNLADLAQAMTPKAATAAPASPSTAAPTPAPAPAQPAPEPEPEPAPAAATKGASAKSRSGKQDTPAAPALVDPMQLWGSLTQQFQQIAATAMKDVSRHTGLDAVKAAPEAASGQATAKAAGKKAATKKGASSSSGTRDGASKASAKSTAKPAAGAATRRR
jgi:hypothetical protein